jgi:hypothetical protein
VQQTPEDIDTIDLDDQNSVDPDDQNDVDHDTQNSLDQHDHTDADTHQKTNPSSNPSSSDASPKTDQATRKSTHRDYDKQHRKSVHHDKREHFSNPPSTPVSTAVFGRKWLILLFFLVMAFLVFYLRYTPYEKTIIHSFPMTINAGDPNSRLSEAEWVYESKQYDLLPPWFSEDKKNIAQHYAPILIIVPAALSQMTGVPIYDSFYLLAVIVSLGIGVVFFILARRYLRNELLAFVAAALFAFPYEYFYHYQINIGMYGNYYTALFYPLALLFLLEFNEKKKFIHLIFLVIIIVLQYYVHASEAIVLLGFVLLYLLLFQRKETGIIKLIGMGLLFIILVIPHLPLFFTSWVSVIDARFTLFKPYTAPAHEVQFSILTLLTPLLYLFFIIGCIALWKKEKYRLFFYLFIFFFFLTFILAYLGIGTYYVTIRTRYLMYVFMYPLAAIGVAAAVKTVAKLPNIQRHMKKSIVITVLVLIIFISQFLVAQARMQGGSLINKDIYDGFLWVRANAKPDAKVLCLGCWQFEGLSTHRITYQVNYFQQQTLQQMVDLANNKTDNSLISMEISGYRDTSPVRKNLFVYEISPMQGFEDKQICNADFVIVKAYGQFTDVFIKIVDRLVARNATVVFSNQNVLVLKNNNVGKVCL